MRRTLRAASMVVLMLTLAIAIVPGPTLGATSEVQLRPILSGFVRPLMVASDGTGNRDLYVVEQGGTIQRVLYRNGRYRRGGTFLDISDRVNDPDINNESGLLGLAFHPGYARNGRFYVVYTRKRNDGKRGDGVIAEYRRQARRPNRANPASERKLLVIRKTAAMREHPNHNADHLVFGPDRKLYISIGDGGGVGDPNRYAQDLGTLWGKILRIDPRDPDGSGPRTHRIPQDNPFVGRAGRNQIWALGTRNPWRFSFDRVNGNLWIGDVGQGAREEVDRAVSNRRGLRAGRGDNYGWSDCEGTLEYNSDEGDPDALCSSHILPIYDYAVDRSLAQCSVIGGHVHRGPGARAWRGLYVAGDFCGRVFVLDQRGQLRWSRDSGLSIASFGEDVAGRIFATGIGEGTLYRVLFRGPRP